MYFLQTPPQPATSRQKLIKQAKTVMTHIAQQIVQDSKAAVMAAAEKGGLRLGEKDGKSQRDLLSVLIRANMDAELHDDQRLSDEDVLARVCSPVLQEDQILH